jgi:hypothetical protein
MASQQQIANFIARRINVGRVQPGQNYWFAAFYTPAYYGPPLPTAQQIAGQLVKDAEFTALGLGGLLNTPTGEFLEQAVELVAPRALSPEFELLVAALKLAAELQQGDARGKAILAVAGSLLLGAILKEIAAAA